jgi:oligopeptide transport system permease protein
MTGSRLAGAIGALLIVGLVLVALAGDRVAGYRFDAQDSAHTLEPPSRAHWLGTDALGRDQLARLAEGARVSLLVAIGATSLALLIGLGYGLVAGWVGGRVDGLMMRAVDVIYALPDVLVIVLLIEVLQVTLVGVPDIARRVAALVAALGFVGWVGIARLVRALVLQAREETWVEAARALGLHDARILLRHVLPNISGPILVAAAFQIPAAILAESTLSFIGLGIQPPFSSWGTLASDGFEAMRSYPYLIFSPCLAILLALVGFHLLGETLRAVLDPRRRV